MLVLARISTRAHGIGGKCSLSLQPEQLPTVLINHVRTVRLIQQSSFLAGDNFTEADVRLFQTLVEIASLRS